MYRGYAPIPWTDFDCIWPGMSHNHRKTTINLSSCCAYWLMIYGCHRKIVTAPIEPMPSRFEVLHHTQLDTHNRLDFSVGVISSSQRPLPAQHTTDTRGELPFPQRYSFLRGLAIYIYIYIVSTIISAYSLAFLRSNRS
jgi:hypothetical protein